MEFLAGFALLSSTLTMLLGLYGIESWRREHQGKRKAELAEETLTLFYEVYDVVRSVRSPMSYSSETDEIVREEHEGEEQYRARRSASVVFVRFARHQELFSKLQAMRYRFRTVFGEDASKPFNDLREITNEIQLAARMLAHYWVQRDWRREEQDAAQREQTQNWERIFWEHSENDDINVKLKKLVDDIDKTCRNVIEGKSSLYSIINWRVGVAKKTNA